MVEENKDLPLDDNGDVDLHARTTVRINEYELNFDNSTTLKVNRYETTLGRALLSVPRDRPAGMQQRGRGRSGI